MRDLTKNYGLFFIYSNKSVFYKAYYTVEEATEAQYIDEDLKQMIRDYDVKTLQIIKLIEEDE